MRGLAQIRPKFDQGWMLGVAKWLPLPRAETIVRVTRARGTLTCHQRTLPLFLRYRMDFRRKKRMPCDERILRWENIQIRFNSDAILSLNLESCETTFRPTTSCLWTSQRPSRGVSRVVAFHEGPCADAPPCLDLGVKIGKDLPRKRCFRSRLAFGRLGERKSKNNP